MNCLTTFSLLLIAVPQFASITEERITVKQGEDVELLCINSRSQDEVVWVTPDVCKDDNIYIEKNLTPCTRRFHTFHKGLSGNQAEMVLKNAHPLDSGYYVCEHWLLDAEYRKIYIKVLDDRAGVEISTLSIVLAVVMVACLSAFLVIFLVVKAKRRGNFVNSEAVSETNTTMPNV